MIDMSHITERFFADFDDIAVINEGWCMAWAWCAWVEHGGSRLCVARSLVPMLADDRFFRIHAYVQLGDRFYDAERPRGVTTPGRLPAVSVCGRRRKVWTPPSAAAFVATFEAENAAQRFRDQGLDPWPLSLPERTTTRTEAA